MPIYEYRCRECRKKFERIVLSSASAAKTVCPKCGASKAERLVSRFATASKGGGDEFGDDLGGDAGEDFGETGGGDFGNGSGGGYLGGDDEFGAGGGSDGDFGGL